MTNWRREQKRQFKVVPNRQYYRLVHIPSGDYIQRYLVDFMTRKEALLCRDRLLEAVPEWDYRNPTLFQEMPTKVFWAAWDAIYGKMRER